MSPFPVRDDLRAAHARSCAALARPGRWLSGATRVAVAAEARAARACALCRERRGALSPNAVAGRHDAVTDLPEATVEVIHRVAVDPGRLSRAFFAAALAGGLSDGEYVELVGVVAQAVAIDSFRRALDLPPEPLPEPEGGEPSRLRPEGIGAHGAWVPTAQDRSPWVGRALSLAPEAVAAMKDLLAAQYVPLERVPDVAFSERTLSRAQMELVAGRVSALNECFY
jgi:hypothetical protein